jgi:hypothetical protein
MYIVGIITLLGYIVVLLLITYNIKPKQIQGLPYKPPLAPRRKTKPNPRRRRINGKPDHQREENQVIDVPPEAVHEQNREETQVINVPPEPVQEQNREGNQVIHVTPELMDDIEPNEVLAQPSGNNSKYLVIDRISKLVSPVDYDIIMDHIKDQVMPTTLFFRHNYALGVTYKHRGYTFRVFGEYDVIVTNDEQRNVVAIRHDDVLYYVTFSRKIGTDVSIPFQYVGNERPGQLLIGNDGGMTYTQNGEHFIDLKGVYPLQCDWNYKKGKLYEEPQESNEEYDEDMFVVDSVLIRNNRDFIFVPYLIWQYNFRSVGYEIVMSPVRTGYTDRLRLNKILKGLQERSTIYDPNIIPSEMLRYIMPPEIEEYIK